MAGNETGNRFEQVINENSTKDYLSCYFFYIIKVLTILEVTYGKHG